MEGSQYLHTPPSSEQDDEVESCVQENDYGNHYSGYEEQEEDGFDEGENMASSLASPPKRKLERTQPRAVFAEKKPRYEAQAEQLWDDTPDLAAYFAFFQGFEEAAQVKYCRAYANALSAKNPQRNRLRYSHKKQ